MSRPEIFAALWVGVARQASKTGAGAKRSWRYGLASAIACIAATCGTPSWFYSTVQDCRLGLAARSGVTVTWLGVAGIYVEDGDTGILIDPFVSRGSMTLRRVAFNRPLVPEIGTISKTSNLIGADDAAAVIVTHTHYDHAIDAPDFASHADAMLYGSASMGRIADSHGYSDFQPVEIGQILGAKHGLGKFEVEFREGRHGGVVMGFVPDRRTVRTQFGLPGRRTNYQVGTVFSLVIGHPAGTIVYTGTAGVNEGMFEGVKEEGAPVVAVLTLTGRDDTTAYLRETVGRTGASTVVPIHFDDLFRPPEQPIRILDQADFEDFVEVLSTEHRGARLRPLPINTACPILPITPTAEE